MFGWADRVSVLERLDDNEISTFKSAMWGLDYSSENLFEIIVSSWLEKSNWNARNSVKSWAIFINEQKISDFNHDFSGDFINGKVLLLRKGKKNFRMIVK
jgi:tyrosyl-tRNA synthetase